MKLDLVRRLNLRTQLDRKDQLIGFVLVTLWAVGVTYFVDGWIIGVIVIIIGAAWITMKMTLMARVKRSWPVVFLRIGLIFLAMGLIDLLFSPVFSHWFITVSGIPIALGMIYQRSRMEKEPRRVFGSTATSRVVTVASRPAWDPDDDFPARDQLRALWEQYDAWGLTEGRSWEDFLLETHDMADLDILHDEPGWQKDPDYYVARIITNMRGVGIMMDHRFAAEDVMMHFSDYVVTQEGEEEIDGMDRKIELVWDGKDHVTLEYRFVDEMLAGLLPDMRKRWNSSIILLEPDGDYFWFRILPNELAEEIVQKAPFHFPHRDCEFCGAIEHHPPEKSGLQSG